MLPYAATAAGALVLLALLLRRRRKRDASQRIKTLVVLGSGGHTAEMLRLITAFDFERYTPLTLVTAATDTTSRAKAERELPRAALSTARWAEIPRAREVGQSFGSSVPSTLRALFACVHLIWTAAPELVLVNGPAIFWLGGPGLVQAPGASLDRDFASPGLLGVRGDGPAGGTTFRDPVAEPRPGFRSRAYVSGPSAGRGAKVAPMMQVGPRYDPYGDRSGGVGPKRHAHLGLYQRSKW